MSDPTPISVDARMSAHEAVCAERWGSIKARMGRLEGIMLAANGLMILGLFAIVGFLAAPHFTIGGHP